MGCRAFCEFSTTFLGVCFELRVYCLGNLDSPCVQTPKKNDLQIQFPSDPGLVEFFILEILSKGPCSHIVVINLVLEYLYRDYFEAKVYTT